MQSLKSSFVFTHIFNIYDLLLLTTFVLAFFLALALLMQRDRKTSNILLAAFVVSQGFYAFYSVMLFNEIIGPLTTQLFSPYHKVPLLVLYGLQGMLLLWYARTMMGESLNINAKTTKVILALTFGTLVVNVYSYSYGVDDYQSLNNFLCNWLLNFCSVVLGIRALLQLKSYESKLPFVHSNLDKHSLSWLIVIAGGFISVWLLSLLAMTFSWLGAQDIAEALYLFRHIPPLILMSAMVVFSQTHVLSTLFQVELPEEKSSATDSYTVNAKVTEQLEDLMARVKVYQDPELRLDGLADSLGISPRSLSTLLNKYYHKNFYDFVNAYRIADVRAQLLQQENKQKPVQRIFEDAGFNSKTTFNTLFKKHTGQTPSEYRKHLELQA
ncbi:MAG: helix-turn-helix domain-containing protein [Aestuariibacter sp.]